MPQLTSRFGPIPQSTVLDANGNGTISFQPNGSNARITTLFVKASTAVKQAMVTLYQGTISDATIIGNTNSGSTGAPAFGNIDLTDGQTLYVVWKGGDAGATAFATFTGKTLPFDQIGDTDIRWSDPIAAGDGSLIYPAMKSPDFTSGVTGWALSRNGDAEFNDVTVRGEFEAANGTVTLKSTGLHIEGAGNQYDINISGGFQSRNLPDDGGQVQVQASTGFGGVIFLYPANSPTAGVTFDPAIIFTGRDIVGSDNTAFIQYQSPRINGTPDLEHSAIRLEGQTSTSTIDNSEIHITGGQLRANGASVGFGWIGGADTSTSSGAIGNVETVLLTTGNILLRPNHAFRITAQIDFNVSVAPNRPLFRIRATNIAGTTIRQGGQPAVNTGQTEGDFSGIFTTGSTPVTRPFLLTVTSGTAAFTVTQLGFCSLDIFDIGEVSPTIHSNAPVVT